jgi:tetratricopeptide (TPR) repeat protein
MNGSGGRSNRVLGIAALLLAVGVLTLLLFLVNAALNQQDVPRTAAERDILRLESMLDRNPGEAEIWSEYIHELTAAEEFGRAEEAVEAAKDEVGEATPVMVEAARLLDARGERDRALEVASAALDQAIEEKEAQLERERGEGVASNTRFTQLITASILKAEVLESVGRWEEAAAAYQVGLDEDPTMADVLVAQGQAYAEAGLEEQARQAFEAALLYVPDYEAARVGLQRLEESE